MHGRRVQHDINLGINDGPSEYNTVTNDLSIGKTPPQQNLNTEPKPTQRLCTHQFIPTGRAQQTSKTLKWVGGHYTTARLPFKQLRAFPIFLLSSTVTENIDSTVGGLV